MYIPALEKGAESKDNTDKEQGIGRERESGWGEREAKVREKGNGVGRGKGLGTGKGILVKGGRVGTVT